MFVLSGCNKQRGSVQESTSNGEVVTIKTIASSGGSGKSLAAAVESFNQAHEGKIKVEIELIANESLLEKYMMQFISGTASYDVLNTRWVPSTELYMAPLNGFLAEAGMNAVELYGKGFIEDATYEGQIRLLPSRSQVYPVYYRTDLFQEAGLQPPKNMQEFLDCARKLTVRNPDGTVRRYGTALQMQSANWTTITFTQWLMPMGGFLVSEDLQHASESLKSNVTYEILNMFKALQDEKLIPDALSWTYDDNVLALQTDRLAFSVESSARATLMEDPKISQVVGKFDYATLEEKPLGGHPVSNLASIWSLGIDKNSKHIPEAWEFIKWACGYEQQKYMAMQFDNGPTVLSIYEEPDYQAINRSALAVKDILAVLPRDYAPVDQTAELQMIVHNELQNFMLGRQTAQQTGEKMYDQIEAAMRK
jgi:multiple sugar transport system substrate-binding protein